MAGLIQQNMGASEVNDAMQQAPIQRQNPQTMERQEAAAMNAKQPAEAPAPEDDKDPEDDPGYTQAMSFAMEALYKNKAATQVADGLKMANNKVDAMANTAYEIISIVDERTDGAVPDELLALFASRVLEEVATIADAAGIEVKPSDVALALKQMILRFLGEQGVDTTQLQQAMDQVDPEEFNRAAAEA
jgi:hypothetical protein